jgi:hypothetical protein
MATTLVTVKDKFILCFQNLSSGGNALIGGDIPTAGQFIYLAGVYGLQANAALTWSPANNNFAYYNNLAMTWIKNNLNSTPTATVDLQGMIDAIFAGTFDQVRDWLGTQWACQQVMWDQPFFVQPYLDMVNRLRT